MPQNATCVGNSATANACLVESRHRKLIGCDIDSDRIELMKSSLIKLFAEQVMNSEYVIEENEAVCTTVCEFLAMWKSSTAWQRKLCLATDQNLCLGRVFSTYFPQYLSSYCSNTDIFDMTKYLPRNQCLERWYSRFDTMDVTALLLHEACAWGVTVELSTIALAYTNLGLRLQDNSTYGNGFMSAFIMTFSLLLFA